MIWSRLGRYINMRYKIPNEEKNLSSVKTMMTENNHIWHQRPLTNTLVKYALAGVQPLLQLREKIPVRNLERVLKESERAASYRFMNTQYDSAADIAKIGRIFII